MLRSCPKPNVGLSSLLLNLELLQAENFLLKSELRTTGVMGECSPTNKVAFLSAQHLAHYLKRIIYQAGLEKA